MKTLIKICIVILFALLTVNCSLLTTEAAVPHLLNYQGRLTDASGLPLNGSYAITFRIYDAEAAGILLWEETHSGVVITKGTFSVLLGSVTALNLAFDKQYFLEIKVGTEVMSPRQRIASSGYALKSEETEKLGGKLPSDYALAADITAAPTANKAVRLDSNAKLPATALKTYDSGWFAVSANTSYTKTHNLGTKKVLVQVFSAIDANGTATKLEMAWALASNYYGIDAYDITTTQITIRTQSGGFHEIPNDPIYGTPITSGYARIIMLALE